MYQKTDTIIRLVHYNLLFSGSSMGLQMRFAHVGQRIMLKAEKQVTTFL